MTISPEYQKVLDEGTKDTNLKATELGTTALKAAVLLNGGSAVALLAFITQKWEPGSKLALGFSPVVAAFSDLVIGTFAAVIATGVAYLSSFIESFYYIAAKNEWRRPETYIFLTNVFLIVAMLLVVYSYVRFGSAMRLMFQTFSPVPA